MPKIRSPKALKLLPDLIVGSSILYLLAFAGMTWLRRTNYGAGTFWVLLAFSLGAVVLLVIFSWARGMKAEMTLVVVCSGILIFGAEMIPIEGLSWQQQRQKAARSRGLPFDHRGVVEVLEDIRSSGGDAWPHVSPKMLVEKEDFSKVDGLLPLAGISQTQTVLCNETGKWTVYNSDEHGFRNLDYRWPQTAKIVLIGDSFAQGACVQRPIGDHLTQLYGDVVNLGVSSNGPLLELAVLREYGERLRPEIVLWFYYEGNDLANLGWEMKSLALAKYFHDETFSRGLIHRQTEIDQYLRSFVEEEAQARKASQRFAWFRRASETIKITNLRARLDKLFFTSPPPVVEEPLNRIGPFPEVLLRAKNLVHTWNGRLVFVYLPEQPRFASSEEFLSLRQEVLSVVQAADIPVIDLVPVFTSQEDPLSLFPFGIFGHYTEDGYSLVSKEIQSFLARTDDMLTEAASP